MIHFDSENAQIEEREEPSYLFEFNFTAWTKADVNQIHSFWIWSEVSDYTALFSF